MSSADRWTFSARALLGKECSPRRTRTEAGSARGRKGLQWASRSLLLGAGIVVALALHHAPPPASERAPLDAAAQPTTSAAAPTPTSPNDAASRVDPSAAPAAVEGPRQEAEIDRFAAGPGPLPEARPASEGAPLAALHPTSQPILPSELSRR